MDEHASTIMHVSSFFLFHQGRKLSHESFNQLRELYLLMAGEFLLTGKEYLRDFKDPNDISISWDRIGRCLYLSDPLGQEMVEFAEHLYLSEIEKMIKLPPDERQWIDPHEFYRMLTWKQFKMTIRYKFKDARLSTLWKNYELKDLESGWCLIPPYMPSRLGVEEVVDSAIGLHRMHRYGLEGRTELLEVGSLDQVIIANIPHLVVERLKMDELEKIIYIYFSVYLSGLTQALTNDRPSDDITTAKLLNKIKSSEKLKEIYPILEKNVQKISAPAECQLYLDDE